MDDINTSVDDTTPAAHVVVPTDGESDHPEQSNVCVQSGGGEVTAHSGEESMVDGGSPPPLAQQEEAAIKEEEKLHSCVVEDELPGTLSLVMICALLIQCSKWQTLRKTKSGKKHCKLSS